MYAFLICLHVLCLAKNKQLSVTLDCTSAPFVRCGKKFKLSSNVASKRGCGSAYDEMWLCLEGVLSQAVDLCWCVWQKCGFSRREFLFSWEQWRECVLLPKLCLLASKTNVRSLVSHRNINKTFGKELKANSFHFNASISMGRSEELTHVNLAVYKMKLVFRCLKIVDIPRFWASVMF
jgi:hypothetical protein